MKINNKFVKPFDISANGTINIKTSDDKNTSLKILAITEKNPVAIQYSKYYTYVIVPTNSMKNLIAKTDQNGSIGYVSYLKANDYDSYAKNIEDFQKTNSVGNFSYMDIKAYMKSMDTLKLFISIFLYGFITIITLIGITNVFNTINTNIQLRRKEFAMLRSVGLSPKGFNKMIYYESIFYGLKALLYGLPAGIALSYLMYYIFGGVGAFSFSLPWMPILICIVAVFLIVYSTMLYAGSKIKKENILDALVSDII